MPPSLKLVDQPPSSGVMLRAEGRVSIGRRSPQVLVCRVVGVIEPSHVDWLVRELDRHVVDGVRTVFVDADRLQSCEPPLSQVFGPWSQRHAETLRSLHVLGSTALVDAQLTDLAPTLGGRLVHHTNTDVFRAAVDEHIG